MLNIERILRQDRLLRATTGLNRKAFEDLAIKIRDSHPKVYEKIQNIIIVNQQDSDKMDTNYRPYEDPYYWAAFTFTGGKLL